MARRTRSNRAEKMEYQRMSALGMPLNAIGLSGLPDELLLLIVSFFPTCRIPEETHDLPENGVAPRHKTLLILTMTCRALRRVCLPFLWQRIEARVGMEEVGNVITAQVRRRTKEKATFLFNEALAREIRRQLETVTVREPKYANYVNIVNLDVEQSLDTLVEDILDSLELFPRLHTVRLRIIVTHHGREHQHILAVLASWMPKNPLASIKRWYSDNLFTKIIAFCPNLHTAGGLDSGPINLSELAGMLKHPMASVERLENGYLRFSRDLEDISDIALKFPNLRHMGISTSVYPGGDAEQLEVPPFGQSLAVFQHLDYVELQVHSGLWPLDESWREALSAGPIEVLKDIQKADKRVKRLSLVESISDLTRRVCDLELPLYGTPAWTEGELEVQP